MFDPILTQSYNNIFKLHWEIAILHKVCEMNVRLGKSIEIKGQRRISHFIQGGKVKHIKCIKPNTFS